MWDSTHTYAVFGSWDCYAAAAASFFNGGTPFQNDFWYCPSFLYLFWVFQGLAGAVLWGILITLATIISTTWICQDLGKGAGAVWCVGWSVNYLCTGNLNALLALVAIWCWRHRATIGMSGGILLGLCSVYPVFPLCYMLLWNHVAHRRTVALGVIMGVAIAWGPVLPYILPLFQSAFNTTGMGGNLVERMVYFVPWHCPWFGYVAIQAWRLALIQKKVKKS